jgi:thiamine kinase-like enzyme
MSMADAAIAELLRRVPGWETATVIAAPLAGGITNRNWLAEVDGRRVVVRVPGERTELLCIDRANEAEAATRAADLGIGPGIAGELPGVGTLIADFVPGHHLDPEPFTQRIDDVVAALRRFHGSGPLRGRFPIHRVVEWHARDAAANGVSPPDAYTRLHGCSLRIEQSFAHAPTDPVPCHNDLLPGNVLFDEAGRVWLLDFEYAGMNDRFFDLGNLAVNCGLDDDAEEELVSSYFGEVTAARLARLRLMKVMSEFREGMWAVVQQAISTLDTDFEAYAADRLGNCERLVSTTAFGTWLDEAAGPV